MSDTWLGRSRVPGRAGVDGYRVDGPEGRVGHVVGVLDGVERQLNVSVGLLTDVRTTVPWSDIVEIDHRRRRVLVSARMLP